MKSSSAGFYISGRQLHHKEEWLGHYVAERRKKQFKQEETSYCDAYLRQ